MNLAVPCQARTDGNYLNLKEYHWIRPSVEVNDMKVISGSRNECGVGSR